MRGTSFDQGRYWSRRGDQYRDEFAAHGADTNERFAAQEVELRQILGGYDLSGVRSLLEIGCGFGRLTPILLDHLPNLERYVGLDISNGQIDAARAASEQWPGAVAEVDFRLADFRTADLGDRFDLVFAGEVFLHFPPDEIGAVLDRARSLATQQLLHIDHYLPVEDVHGVQRLRWALARARGHSPLHRTNWEHDYPRLYPTATVTLHPILDGWQHLFVVRG
jgi:SAM-dependent methyltransferase